MRSACSAKTAAPSSPPTRSWRWRSITTSTRRKAYQEKVEEERQAKVAAKQAELETLAGELSDVKILIAVATKGGGRVNEHFGHAKEFQVYELSTAGAKFVGHRRVDLYCQGGFGDEDSLESVIRAINDCAAVFVAKIGGCPKDDLQKAGHRAGRSIRA